MTYKNMSLSQNIYNSTPISYLTQIWNPALKAKLKMCLRYISISLRNSPNDVGYLSLNINDDKRDRFKDFLSLINNYVDELNDDLSNYSKFKLKMTLELNGFDEDESFYYIKILRNIFLDNRMGILDLQKPVELSNNIIALLEF